MATMLAEKSKTTPLNKWLLLIYLSLVTVLFLLFVLNAWWMNLLDLGMYLGNPSVPPFPTGTNSPDIDVLVVIVLLVEFLGYSLLLGAGLWLAGNVVDFARGKLGAYQNLLTVAVGLVIIAFAFVSPSQPLPDSLKQLFLNNPFSAFLEHVNLLAGVAALLNLMLVLGLVYYNYYPEYRKMSLLAVLRDLRVIRVGIQIIFAVVVLFFIAALFGSIYSNLAAKNTLPNFDFLFKRAGFQISQSPDWYSSNSRYGDAFIVGVMNTLNVVWIGLLLSTIIGVFLGIFLLSRNWLIRNISNVYVEILRNTPLLVQLIFWYFVVWFSLPKPETPITVPNEAVLVVYLRFFVYLLTILGVWLYAWRDEKAPPRLLNGVLTAVLLLEAVFYLLGDSYIVIVLLALGGAGLIYAAKQRLFIPESQEGFAIGIGILALSQFAGHLMLDGLAMAGMISHARFVYGEMPPLLYISKSNFIMPKIIYTLRSGIYGLILLLGFVLAIVLYIIWGRVIERTGRDIPRSFYAFLVVLGFAVAGWFILAQPLPSNLYVGVNGNGLYMIYEAEAALNQQVTDGELEAEDYQAITSPQALVVRAPEVNNFGTLQIGTGISPSYMALLIGLVIYTSAFIGEIVRAGIQAVPYGQIEAARALGLSQSQTLRMIVLPQALRVIIPPLGNQYLNLSKNSTLAVFIAYADTYQVGTTIMNQSGQSVTGFLIILIVYLVMSLIISYFMNIVNARFQLVTR